MADHAPAARRRIIRRLRGGEHPNGLLADAQQISEAGHRAVALLALAADERLPAAKAAAAVRQAKNDLAGLEQPGRIAEAWGDALDLAPGARGPAVDDAMDALRTAAVDAVVALPDGQWLSDAVLAVAPYVSTKARVGLLQRAWADPGSAVQVANAIARIDANAIDAARDGAPPEVLARLAGDDVDDGAGAAWAIQDMAKRREAIRVLADRLRSPEGLMALGEAARGRPADDQVATWTQVGARLDRLGHDAGTAFAQAVQALGGLEAREAAKAHRKLAQAMQRSGLEPPAPPEAARPGPAPDAPAIIAGTRHTLALVNGYSGHLGPPHVRALARAAPLCIAFDLDLALLGFPTDDAAAFVALVEAETHVGEGMGYARRLLKEGRLHLHSLHHGLPAAWPGTPVATTPTPDPEKARGLTHVHGPICLLVGQGRAGLPKRMLNAAPVHHELTGQGISLETATAMGVLADRLGRIPVSPQPVD